jgi:sarcosine oxidase, subunit gamma
MADTTPAGALYRVHPPEHGKQAPAGLPGTLSLEAEPGTAAVDLRLDPAAAEAVAGRIGGALPTTPNTWCPTADGQAIWLGPDEWLVTSDTARPHDLEAALLDVVRPCGGAAVDVSAQRTSLRLGGRHARDLLASGCSLDLHPLAFPFGACAQTTIGRAGVLLLALGSAGTDFRLFVRLSFAGYLTEWLLDAAVEFRASVPAIP